MTAAFYGLCVALMLVMKLAPLAPLGRWLNRNLVEEPLVRLSALERHHLIFIAIVLVMAWGAGETIAIYGTFEWAVISAFDMSVYLDAVAATVALGAVARIRAGIQLVRVRLAGRRRKTQPAVRHRRAPRVRRKAPAPSANDDRHPAFALAA